MKQIATYYRKFPDDKIEIEYDDEAPCKICGEPVTGSSMGGTVICPWCDCGKCRYCGMTIFAIREEIDGGESLKRLREHMKWHRDNDPKYVGFNERALAFHRKLAEELKQREQNKNVVHFQSSKEQKENP